MTSSPASRPWVYLRVRSWPPLNEGAKAVTTRGLGANMKRISIAVILMLVLAACSSQSGGDQRSSPSAGQSGDQRSSPSAEQSGDGRNDGPSGSPSDSAYNTVSGEIVDRATGQPYPNAYVRFGWLVDAVYEKETHTVTDGSGRYEIQLPAGQYQVTAGDSCDLNAGFAIVGRSADDVMITVPGTNVVDFVEYPISPGADLPGVC